MTCRRENTTIEDNRAHPGWYNSAYTEEEKEIIQKFGMQRGSGRIINLLNPLSSQQRINNKHLIFIKKILKSKTIVKVMVFPIVMYRCESWTIKKAECRRIDAFKLCWGRLLRVAQRAGRSKQTILKEIFIGKTDAEDKAPILWPPDEKS